MFRSATFKLTAWYLLIVMVISLGFSISVYHFATSELSYGLNNQTQRIFNQFPVFNDNPYLRVRGEDVSAGAHHILVRLVYFNLLVLVGAGLASYWLARRTLEPIEAAHDRQKRFTADVSHELRTPLTSLKMNSEVALLDPKANRQELQSTLQSNVEDAIRMEQLINSLLRLTKLDNDDSRANFESIPSTELVTEAIAHIQMIADNKHITIEQDVKAEQVYGDRDSLVQLLVILLDNALKYSPNQTTVHVTSHTLADSLQIIIRDEGQGISREALPHVFERFYREDTARTSSQDGEGYGLGLSIAKMIADRNKADITLTSRPGKGTTATVNIPLASKSKSV